jgi:CheY-like chemotaxis protein
MTPLILLAEDDPDDALFLRRAIRDARLDVRLAVATDGAKALELLAGDERPSLLVLDLKMPRVDGLEVLRRVRADGKLKELPVVVLSSSFERVDREQAEALGVDLFLRKPSDAAQYATIAGQLRGLLEASGAMKAK